MLVYIHIHMQIHMHMHIYVHIYAYTYTYTHMHMYIYLYRYVSHRHILLVAELLWGSGFIWVSPRSLRRSHRLPRPPCSRRCWVSARGESPNGALGQGSNGGRMGIQLGAYTRAQPVSHFRTPMRGPKLWDQNCIFFLTTVSHI